MEKKLAVSVSGASPLPGPETAVSSHGGRERLGSLLQGC